MKRTSELPRGGRKRSKIDPQTLPTAMGEAKSANGRLGSRPKRSWGVSEAP